LQKIAKVLQIKVRTLIIYAGVVMVLLVILNYGAFIITSLVALIYPAYMSMKAINKKNHKKTQYWLTYWIIIGLLDFIQPFFSSLPYWFLINLSFIIYLFHPTTLGAMTVYVRVLRPFLRKYEK